MENKMNKKELMRTVIAVGVSIAIIVLWFLVLEPLLFPRPQVSMNDEEVKNEYENSENYENNENYENASDEYNGDTGESSSNYISNLELSPVNIANTDDFERFETQKYIVVFNKKGGVIQDIRYKDFVKENGDNKVTYESGIYAESILESDKNDFIERPLRATSLNFITGKNIENEATAKFDYHVNESNNEVILTSLYKDKEGNKIEISKKYKFKIGENGNGKHNFDLEISLRNLSENDITIANDENVSFYIHWGGGVGPYAEQSSYDRWEPYIAKKVGGNIDVARNINDFDKMDRNNKGIIPNLSPAWVGCGNRYFLVSLMPDYLKDEKLSIENVVYNTDETRLKNQSDFFGIGYSGFILKKGETKSTTISIYAGPKRHGDLSKYGLKLEITAEHGGIIEFLVRFVEWLLLSINSFINNFGISIFIITLLLRLALYPLQAKSLKSMGRMKDLQPKMDEIKAKYKDKPEQMNKAMMDLYKKEKINPMGGCLPMLLQFPFFIAFFNVMPYLVDLKGQAFLWATDLSAPDTIAYLPFFPNQINLFPLIMAGVMVVNAIMQKQISPPTTTNASGGGNMKILTYALPVIFLLITYYAPSGLTIYWTFSTLLGIGQQALFNFLKNRNNGKKVEILDTKGKPVKRK
jgi:YidC/Oxa1 family membrane protein insertase